MRDDDDDLRRKLNEAAKGNLAKTCIDVRPIKELLLEHPDVDVELDVLTVVADKVPNLTRPLGRFGPPWLIRSILEFSRLRRAAPAPASRTGDPPPPELIFAAEGTEEWRRCCAARLHFEQKKPPPSTAKNPSGRGSAGWFFPKQYLDFTAPASAEKAA